MLHTSKEAYTIVHYRFVFPIRRTYFADSMTFTGLTPLNRFRLILALTCWCRVDAVCETKLFYCQLSDARNAVDTYLRFNLAFSSRAANTQLFIA